MKILKILEILKFRKNLKIEILDFPGFFLKIVNFVIQSPKAGPAPRVHLVGVRTRFGRICDYKETHIYVNLLKREFTNNERHDKRRP